MGPWAALPGLVSTEGARLAAGGPEGVPSIVPEGFPASVVFNSWINSSTRSRRRSRRATLASNSAWRPLNTGVTFAGGAHLTGMGK